MITEKSGIDDPRYAEAMATVQHAIGKLHGCSEQEKQRLTSDLDQLRSMAEKLTHGRIEIVVFGEISTGKSALINALIGDQVAAVNVRGGWTQQVWHVPWDGCGYEMEGMADSSVVLVDTPGLNEVGGDDRADMAIDIAARADLILFVVDSDITDTEYDAIVKLATANKPIIVVLNKRDLYTDEELDRLQTVITEERLPTIVPADNIVLAAANPRQVEYVIESADGRSRSEWRDPEPDVGEVKSRILEVLEHEGLALLALNAAMFAADKTDRVAKIRVQLRDDRANRTIWSFAAAKALAVALNPVPAADVLGGSAVDVSMVVTLAHIYGLEMSWMHARKLMTSIGKAAGWITAAVLAEWTINLLAGTFKAITLGTGTAVTAVPQGAVAGYGSYIVGQAAKYYFEHGASWGTEAPKTVVRRILDQTDRDSVLQHLKDEIRGKIQWNRYTDNAAD